jgi:hypothetical protein
MPPKDIDCWHNQLIARTCRSDGIRKKSTLAWAFVFEADTCLILVVC